MSDAERIYRLEQMLAKLRMPYKGGVIYWQ
jgi:hypothetical protein